ncbi:Mor transcription activator family protein [Salinicola sp. RZ23]|uniref:Mor transcription activator family protein n=1 Tax=Salinicola sp. RZ23 TaxID=1949087 RepID=UPI000DA1D9EA|nr:Mor transcription activator family protein [Salinicola sp. RZ23]
MSKTLELFPAIPDDAAATPNDPALLAKWPGGLVDLIHTLERTFRDAGAEPHQARHWAFTTVRALATHHGGHSFYLPRGQRLETALRDREMFETFDGTRASITALAAHHRLSEMHVYAIIAQQRRLARARRQPALL